MCVMRVCLCVCVAYHLEAACEVELALHHVKEDGDGGLAQLDLGHQRHLQDWSHHLRDELDLVRTCRGEVGEIRQLN